MRDAGIDATATNALQRAAVETSRLGIPLLIARDVIHGHRTVFPIPLGQAASFDPDLVREYARVAAREASADGIRWTFAPMLDVGPVILHNRHLRPFRAAVRAGVATVMSAFHTLDGTPMTAHVPLVRRNLKGDLGFSGPVVSDWDAIGELGRHGLAEDRRQAAVLALQAGVDVDMVTGAHLTGRSRRPGVSSSAPGRSTACRATWRRSPTRSGSGSDPPAPS